MAITTGTFYQEPGYSALDNVDGDLTQQVQVDGEVDWLTPGTYSVTYTVTDGYKNTTTVTRTVEVQAVPRPEVVWPEGKVIYLTFDDGPGPYTEQLLDVLDTLTPREEKVLRLRFGLDDGHQRTLEEVGREFKVTRERIRQIEAKALRKLRHPSRSKKLKDYLD
mgnify:CR=1 FL=1